MQKKLDYYLRKAAEAKLDFGANYHGIATFLGAHYSKSLKNVDIGLLGIPFDIATSNYPGTRLGPRAIRDVGKAPGFLNRETNVFPYELVRIADIGDVPLNNQFSIEKTCDDISNYYKSLKKKQVTPITAGGDHFITYPILKGLFDGRPISLIHFDSHCDTTEEYGGSKFHHGTSFINAFRDNLIDPSTSIQIGIRDGWDPFWNQELKSKMAIIYVEDFYEMGVRGVIRKIKEIVGRNHVYVSFDIDCLDPAFAPGTGSPEIGGITSFEARKLIRGLTGLNIIGADIVEVCPMLDPSGITALAGATLMFELLCVIASNQKKK